MGNLTKDHAKQIVKKLGAVVREKKGPHDLAIVFVGDVRVTQFGIRRGSKRDGGHDHIPGNLHVTAREARDLAECPMSRDAWIAVLREKRILPPIEDDSDDRPND